MKEIFLKSIDEKIYYEKCENGLDVYFYLNPNVNNFYMTLNVKYGSKDTEFSLQGKKESIKVPNGVAHFLEHVMFNMPDGKTAHEMFNKLGSNINAFTTYAFTAYEVFASTHFSENLNYLLDYVNTPYFTKENVNKEKGIIIEEIKMYKDSPGSNLYYKVNENLYTASNKRFPIAGTVEDVKSITEKDLQLVYDNFYHPENMFLVITGNFNKDEALALIKENQSTKKFPKYRNPKIKSVKEKSSVVEKFAEIADKVSIPRVSIAFKMPRSKFKNINDLKLKTYLNYILKAKFCPTGNLKEELLKNNLITGSISYGRAIVDNYVIIKVGTETKYPHEFIKRIEQEFNSLNVTEEEFNRNNKCFLAALISFLDDIEQMNSSIEEIIINDDDIENYFNICHNLDIKELNYVIKNISTKAETVVIMNPDNEPQKKDS